MLADQERRSREVSELYWGSDSSVAEIAEKLQLSRRALYEAVMPTQADATCPVCGGELVFTTRSARAAGRAECSSCGQVQDAAALRELRSRQAEETARPGLPVDSEGALLRGRTVLLFGFAVAGAAAAAIAALVASRR